MASSHSFWHTQHGQKQQQQQQLIQKQQQQSLEQQHCCRESLMEAAAIKVSTNEVKLKKKIFKKFNQNATQNSEGVTLRRGDFEESEFKASEWNLN